MFFTLLTLVSWTNHRIRVGGITAPWIGNSSCFNLVLLWFFYFNVIQLKTRWKPRTRMYSRSWTTNANLCNRKTNLFLHASCPHTVSAKAPEQQFTKIQLTSTTTSPPAQRNHNQHNNITSAMKPQRNHPHNEITSATKSQAQQHHQRNEITSTTNAPAEWNHQRTAPAQQNHQSKRNH